MNTEQTSICGIVDLICRKRFTSALNLKDCLNSTLYCLLTLLYYAVMNNGVAYNSSIKNIKTNT